MSVRPARPVYYNENDPFCVAWLKNLIAAGHLPAGDVDDRPIQEVQAADLAGYDQCHFFAGIGGWPYAMQLAGWGDRPVWTGSCPCQPFSVAGKSEGHKDERHLWPTWFRLIREHRPATCFGEQVTGDDGRAWLDAVFADLESCDYAVAAGDIPAAGVGSPHARQRLWWVADADYARRQGSERQGEPDATGLWSQGGRLSSACCQLVRPTSGHWPPGPHSVHEIPLRTDGVSARVGKMRAYGNAIVPQVAAAFVSAYLDVAAVRPVGASFLRAVQDLT